MRLKRRRAPLPASVAHAVPAAQPPGAYAPWGQSVAQPTGAYVPYNADDPQGQGQVPPYTPAGYGADTALGNGKEEFAPLYSVPELKSRESSGAHRHDHGVV